MAKKESKVTKKNQSFTGKSKKKPVNKISKSALGKKATNAVYDSFPLKALNEIGDCFAWEADSYPLRKIVYSENIFNVTGYKNNDASRLPNGHFHLAADDDKEFVNSELLNFISNKDKNSCSFLYHITTSEQKLKWVKEKILIERGSKDNSIKKIKGIVYDITDVKHSEEYFYNKISELELLNASKDKFISKLSHDLRSPYTSILGFVEILMSEPGLSSADRLEYLNYIHASAERQLRFINCLLDWSRIKTGRINYQPQRIRAVNAVYNCVASLTHESVRKNIEIKVNINDSIFIFADEKLFNQVIINLVSNAIKYSEEYKTIEIFADIFNYNMVEFIVKDGGVGIPDKNKDKIFKIEDLFSTEGTKGERGTGAGLPLVKEIVNKHNGEIWFYSEKNKGSEFHFTVPYSHNSILYASARKKKDNSVEKFIQNNFKDLKLTSAGSAFECIEFITNYPPSIIILEDNLPLMNGSYFIQYLMKEDKYIGAHIILIVENYSEENIKKFHGMGIKNIIPKPVSESTLFSSIKNLIEQYV